MAPRRTGSSVRGRESVAYRPPRVSPPRGRLVLRCRPAPFSSPARRDPVVREFSELPYNQFMSSWWEWLSRGVGMQTTVSITVREKNRDRPCEAHKTDRKAHHSDGVLRCCLSVRTVAPVPGPWLRSARTVSVDAGVEHDDP